MATPTSLPIRSALNTRTHVRVRDLGQQPRLADGLGWIEWQVRIAGANDLQRERQVERRIAGHVDGSERAARDLADDRERAPGLAACLREHGPDLPALSARLTMARCDGSACFSTCSQSIGVPFEIDSATDRRRVSSSLPIMSHLLCELDEGAAESHMHGRDARLLEHDPHLFVPRVPSRCGR